MRTLAVVPARFDSSRLPGKPLARIGDRTMIQRVHDAASSSGIFERVVVATDDDRIADEVHGFGGEVELTSSDHETGTDRVAEVAGRHPWADVVVNVQGDQPFVTTEMLASLIDPFRDDPAPAMTTLACPLPNATNRDDPNVVKVLIDRRGMAIYFTRASVPYERNAESDLPVHHHLGLYGFDRNFLEIYAGLESTPLERCEGLEQLRVLEHGHRIAVRLVDRSIIEVNTAEDLVAAEDFVAKERVR